LTQEHELSISEEEYIEALYNLMEEGKTHVRTSELAERLGVSPPSVTEMVKGPLARKKLVVYTPYKGVRLTAKGREAAARVVRRHRIAERLLADIVGVEWEKCHEEACKLEHALSDEVADKLAATLKNPATCPHGNVIPPPTGEIRDDGSKPLLEFSPPLRVRVVKIVRESRNLLRRLAAMGILPGVELKIVKRAPFNGPILVDLDGFQVALSGDIAKSIMVIPVVDGA